MTSYLVIREGSKWADVFRLVDGESVTVGRAPTSTIVVKDERCSRNHAEIFQVKSKWMLRDLDSRNGTQIDGVPVEEDYSLKPGDIIRIGNSHLAFVDNLSHAFPDSSSVIRSTRSVETEVGDPLVIVHDDSVFEPIEPTQITHRREQSKFLISDPEQRDSRESPLPKVGREAAKLCRLAFELAKTTDVISLANTSLAALFESTPIDAGSMLLRGRDAEGGRTLDTLEVIVSRAESAPKYHRVSQFLAATVLRDGQGVLARNVMDDSQLGARDSSGDILATSVICVPIRVEGQVLGLLHLYSIDAAKPVGPDDLEFTLAVADTVSMTLQNLDRRQELSENLNLVRDENVQLREQLGVQSEIIGGSQAMAHVEQQIGQAAPSRATVLIRGESGVGKELVARAVHFSSPRRKGPFVCLNCAALSETLLESELFGHEKGAFTGATHRKIGKFESANKGTLMLDEIGEMSPTIQAKFLRVLEGHAFERVGGTEPISADVRVIAATNRDLEKEVGEGRFRRDLYFRLHVLEIVVPPLRKRPEDVVELAQYFLHRFNTETGQKIKGFSTLALEELRRYRWPGNVRELKNVIERAVVLSRGEYIDCDDLILSNIKTAGDTDASLEGSAGLRVFEPCSLAEMEQQHVLATLQSTGWNKSKTAAVLGIERSTLDRKIQRYDLNRYREAAKR